MDGRHVAQKAVIHTPVIFEGQVVGKAEISECGEIITAELHNAGDLPANLRAALTMGLADGISLAPNYTPVVPTLEERKKARWFSKSTPWGM